MVFASPASKHPPHRQPSYFIENQWRAFSGEIKFSCWFRKLFLFEKFQFRQTAKALKTIRGLDETFKVHLVNMMAQNITRRLQKLCCGKGEWRMVGFGCGEGRRQCVYTSSSRLFGAEIDAHSLGYPHPLNLMMWFNVSEAKRILQYSWKWEWVRSICANTCSGWIPFSDQTRVKAIKWHDHPKDNSKFQWFDSHSIWWNRKFQERVLSIDGWWRGENAFKDIIQISIRIHWKSFKDNHHHKTIRPFIMAFP